MGGPNLARPTGCSEEHKPRAWCTYDGVDLFQNACRVSEYNKYLLWLWIWGDEGCWGKAGGFAGTIRPVGCGRTRECKRKAFAEALTRPFSRG